MKPDLEANQNLQIERGTNSRNYRPRTHGSLALVAFADSANAEVMAYAADAGRRLQAAIEARRANDWQRIVAGWTPTDADLACFGGVHALIKAAPDRRLALYTPPIVLATVIYLSAPNENAAVLTAA